jgi:hypothetical protein
LHPTFWEGYVIRSTALALGALALALTFRAAPARACSICGCGDPLLAANDPAAITGGLRLQLDTEYLSMTSASESTGASDELTQWSYRLDAVWRPAPSVSLHAVLPLVSKTLRTTSGGALLEGSTLTGLGDAELGGRWAFWSRVNFGARRVQEAALSAGSSLPTGQNDARGPSGAVVDPHGQLGTGALGPFAGLHYRYEQGDWSAFASLSYRLRLEGSYPEGLRYKFGDAVVWSLHGQYQAAKWLSLDLGLDARHAAPDRAREDGAPAATVENTGGTVIALAPGVYARTVGDLWLFARAQVPVVKRLTGVQDVLPTFTMGVQLQVF